LLPKLHYQSVIGFGRFLLLRQKALHQHRRGVCTSLFPAGCLGRTRVILVVDDELVQSINWIKEGTFSEKEGAPTLKLIGKVQPIDTVEVVKKERINRLKKYTLSATELADKIKAKSSINKNDIWRIINENHTKDDADYSIYNFRSKSQEELYEQKGEMPKGVPSIYKETAVDYIINIYNNEH